MKIYLAHSKKMNYINQLYNPIKRSFFYSNYEFYFPYEESNQSYNTYDYYKQFDLVIAEVSKAETGIGIELGFAYSLNIPILCFYKKGSKYSSSLKSITNIFVEYDDVEDFILKLYLYIDKKII